jgi:hypothetical protein
MRDHLWDQTRKGIFIAEVTSFSCKGFWNFVGKGFVHAASVALSNIASRPVGRELLGQIAAHGERGSSVVVTEAARLSATGATPGTRDDRDQLRVAVAWYNFSASLTKDIDKKIETERTKLVEEDLRGMIAERDEMQGIPSFVSLAHELIHALHYLDRGVPSVLRFGEKVSDDHEEARTVGLGIYSREPICENTIRAEHRLPLRDTYSGDRMTGLRALPGW